ncbi:Tn3 family transposase (plasmid) [Acaryochloris sp. 'Moss Beach']|uniref:Tn3 family transposase n=1 Tax=Acaryochloris sp. 'Moss Beach' TaxID=2740837 RepID=UPI001F28199B|nr:Tn3 family transposase [Acaryochloris sp. 'Moss Beach']UJB72243.1 Tn3 family transposase [Acaryochloris sp. 'Moss Beach']
MKRQWQPDELIESFILLPNELALVPNYQTNATEHNQLGFAVLLKFFQLEGRFPKHLGEIPQIVVEFIAKQLKLTHQSWVDYKWKGRTIKEHRAIIRSFLGCRPTQRPEKKSLMTWLKEKVMPLGLHLNAIREQAYQRLRHLKLEPPSPKELTRLISSAAHNHEQDFCQTIAARLPADTRTKMDVLLETEYTRDHEESQFRQSDFNRLKSDPGRLGLKSLFNEIDKLQSIRQIQLPKDLFDSYSLKLIEQYRRRASADLAGRLRRHPKAIRYTLIASFCYQREKEITDNLVDLLIQIIHRLSISAERRVERELIANFKRVNNKEALLYQIAEAALANPDQPVKEVIYPVASPDKLTHVIEERKRTGITYREKVNVKIRASYLHHYRQMVPAILETLAFHSNNEQHRPVIDAIALLRQYQGSRKRYFAEDEKVITTGVLKSGWRDLVVEPNAKGQDQINRVNYEICVLQSLREKLRCREVWVMGAKRYGNPDMDLPQDFEAQREQYYLELNQPLDAETFVRTLKQDMTTALASLNTSIPNDPLVNILPRDNGWISVTPFPAQDEPGNIHKLKQEVAKRWPMTSLLDILKETDLRVNFTDQFHTVASRQQLNGPTLQKRLLLSLFGLGTNMGLKRVCAGIADESYANLLYVKRQFLHREHLRNAISEVVNATLKARMEHLWGEATTACASDSKKFGAWDQNLMTEWHSRYGGKGVMIYWHVEKKSLCVYSQLKTCSSSEVSSMLTGLLRHNTDLKLEKNYVDTHGQSELGFAFCHLLGFQLMPRFKRIGAQKLSLPEAGMKEVYPNLKPVLSRAIDWELVTQQYDQAIKYATALRLGTAEAEDIFRRFGNAEIQHPTHKALLEIGKAVKTIFLCQYLSSEALRVEINEGLNVVERWNGANDFIYFGRGGEFATNKRENQELSALALHLLQVSMIYINTLMIQNVLSEPKWMQKMETEDLRALSPLIWNHVTPYGWFNLDFTQRIALDIV